MVNPAAAALRFSRASIVIGAGIRCDVSSKLDLVGEVVKPLVEVDLGIFQFSVDVSDIDKNQGIYLYSSTSRTKDGGGWPCELLGKFLMNVTNQPPL